MAQVCAQANIMAHLAGKEPDTTLGSWERAKADLKLIDLHSKVE